MSKKPTNKEIVAKVEMLTRVNNIAIEMIDNVGNTIKQYIEFKGDITDFHKYQQEIADARKKLTSKE